MKHRRIMISEIVKLLKQRDKNQTASPEWLRKLPQMVKQLEVSLYRSAPSFEAYSDISTLKNRLQQLAVEISEKTQQAKRKGLDHQDPKIRMSSDSTSDIMPQSLNSQNLLPHQKNAQYQNQTPQQQMINQRNKQLAAQRQKRKQQAGQPQSQNTQHGGGGRPVVNVSDINPIIGGPGGNSINSPLSSSLCQPTSLDTLQQGAAGGMDDTLMQIPAAHGSAFPPLFGSENPKMSRKQNHSPASSGNNTNNMSSSYGVQKSDPDWNVRVRQKQQRLLLLHHSSKCQHEDGKCRVTPYCGDMKRLWKHMAKCTDHRCEVGHCYSSRTILSHYRKCKDTKCSVCGPVRDIVKKSGRPKHKQPPKMEPEQIKPVYPSNSSRPPGSLIGSMNPMPVPRPYQQQPQAPMPSNKHPTPFMASDEISPIGNTPLISSTGSSSYNVETNDPFNRQMKSSNPFGGGNHLSSSMGGGESSSGSGGFRPDNSGFGLGGVNPPPFSGMTSNSSQNLPPNGNVDQPHQDQDPNHQDPNYKIKIKHKQQRLLLLRHASKCTYEEGKCPVTQHCAAMKQLWKHIAHCKDQNCEVQHCLSSRYVLSHFRKCKDPKCAACVPVRESIRKSQREREQNPEKSQPAGPSVFPIESPQPVVTGRKRGRDDATRAIESANSMGPGSTYESPGPVPDTSHTSPIAKKLTVRDSPKNGSHLPQVPPTEKPDPSRRVVSKPAISPPTPVPPQPPQPPRSDSVKKPRPAPIHKKVEKVSSAPVEEKKPQEEPSMINGFTIEQIEKHIASLNPVLQMPPAKMKAKCLEILKSLQSHQHGWVFNCPVDPVELALPDYFEIIKHPMDLGTIQTRLEKGSYHALDDFSADVRLTFDNAMTYNQEGSVVHNMGKELKAKFISDYDKLICQLKEEEKDKRQNDRACKFCGNEKLLFEPPVYFCNGVNCSSSRIRRNSHYYVGGNNQYYWCNTCYNDLNESNPIELGDLTIKKSELKKKKNDEIHEEGWVQCDTCERWVHQICCLFNTRLNTEHKSKYNCPQCAVDKRKKLGGDVLPPPKAPMADDLPRTKLSEILENCVRKKVEERRQVLIKERSEAEKISLKEAKESFNMGGPVTIRQVTSMNRNLEVRERMRRRYAHKNYPDEFPFRCKCIVVFQNIDGVDVILFALYLYEHGPDNPSPNKRTVYISYLDSVHYMRPRKMRTFIYHEILISYLDYARDRGFATAHIWACPPLKGDDYIFYSKPNNQKTPKDDRLRQWYIDMLVECQKRDIVGKITNMYDLYFSDAKHDATVVPYLEGDYFPGEAENIIKDLEDGGGKKGGSGGKKRKKKNGSSSSSGSDRSKSKNKSGRGGTRSAGIDENTDTTPADYKDGGPDPVMKQLGDTIKPMKESFIVAFLNWAEAREEDKVVPKEISDIREERRLKEIEDKKENCSNSEAKLGSPSSMSEGKLKKRDSDGKVRGVSFDPSVSKCNRGVKILDDDVEDMDCEFFNNRQAFLNLCRGNHYQFDELRRAKHTSMMVLWHLHNRDAPKFVQQCAACSREIVSGHRHHCPTCSPDFDLCDECFKNPKTDRGQCTHKLEKIKVENTQSSNNNGTLTPEQRRERQRNIQLHIQLLEHAASCTAPVCNSSNCPRMKGFLKHSVQCKQKASGGCKICKRIWTLLRIHATQCKKTSCPIPQCTAIRERIRQLQKQQQAMDDRRRQEMNRTYRGGHSSDGR